jgi:hypothetical protein
MRVWRGSRFSPFARLALCLSEKHPTEIPGLPKRFAQLLGALLLSISTLLFILGWQTAALAAVVLLLFLALLEAAAGICLGCIAFANMMRRGWIPESLCQRCAPIYDDTADLD